MANQDNHFQIAVVGGGPGGYIAALKAASLGARTALVEKHHLGGTCLNYGCIPSKALLASSELLHRIRHSQDMGLQVEGEVSFNWPQIQKRKDKVVQTLRKGIGSLLKGRQVTVFNGHGKVDGAGRLAITHADGAVTTITADHTILALGSVPARIPGWPDDPARVCTSDEAVHWKELPASVLVVGGGVIGCELACMLAPLGVQVTIVEMLPRLLPPVDASMSEVLAKTFKQRGISCYTGTKIQDMAVTDRGITATLENGEKISAEKALVATGRRPNTADAGLETIGIEMKRGFIPVDDLMQTTAKGYSCIGDANGRCLLAHAASAHGMVAVENILGHGKPFQAPVPNCIYTFPEIGSVGLSEDDARDKGIPFSTGRFPLAALGRALAAGESDGMVKIIRHRETDEVLGVHMIGHSATECIAAAGALLHQKATVHDVVDTVFAHPTMSEAIREAGEDALSMALHLPPRKIMRVAV